MKKKNFIYLNDNTRINIPKLIQSRFAGLANSGGGKSWLVRRVAEQAVEQVQTIIIDPEGEFSSLREKFDFVLCGKGYEVPAEVRSAAKLAEMLLESKASAIIDLYELPKRERRLFVKVFFEAMIDAPKRLYHDALVILDEAHDYVPEGKPCESTSAVEAMASKGRKRGFCLGLFSQRLSKISKDAISECNNVLIGRATWKIDRKIAAEELGLTDKEEILALKKMKPGEFYVTGPAISDDLEKIQVGPVETKHNKGYKRSGRPRPASPSLRKALAQLKNLPEEAEAELKTLDEMRAKIRTLEADLRTAKKDEHHFTVKQSYVPDRKAMKKEIDKAAQTIARREIHKRDLLWEKVVDKHVAYGTTLSEAIRGVVGIVSKAERLKLPARLPKYFFTPSNLEEVIVDPVKKIDGPAFPVNGGGRVGFGVDMGSKKGDKSVVVKAEQKKDGTTVITDATEIPKAASRVLEIIASRYPMWLMPSQVAMLCGVKATTGSFKNYLSTLKKAGMIEEDGTGALAATELGKQSAGTASAAPRSAEEVINMWKKALPGPQEKIFSLLVERRGLTMSNGAIAEQLGVKHDTGSFKNYISSLYKNKLIKIVSSPAALGGQEISLNEDIFNL